MLIVAAWVGNVAPARGAISGGAGGAGSVLGPLPVAPGEVQDQGRPETPDPAEDAPQRQPSGAEVVLSVGTLAAAPLILALLWFADVLRPGSFRRAGARQVMFQPWPVWLCGALLVFLAAPLGGQTALVLARIPADDTESLRSQGIIAIGSYVISVAAAVLLIRVVRKHGPGASSDVRSGLWARLGDLPRGLLAIVLAYPVVAAVSYGAVRLEVLITGHTPDAIAHRSLEAIVEGAGDPWAWVVAGAAILGAPIVEETIYRVFLTAMFLRLGLGPWPAILVCSTLFALTHIGSVPGWYAMVPLGVLGLAMGLAYERTKRLGVPIAMHACFNAFNVAVAVWAS